MDSQTTDLKSQFSLNMIFPYLAGFTLPEGDFGPTGHWQLSYGVFTLTRPGGRTGRLLIKRKPLDDKTFDLEIDYSKTAPKGCSQKTKAKITCRNDKLSTPLKWSLESQIFDSSANPIKNTKISNSAIAKEKSVEIKYEKYTQKIDLANPYTINWSLFDAVQRLNGEKIEPVDFTLLDHFDQPKPNQTLSYRQTLSIKINAQTTTLHAYDHLGDGIVPWVYWIDESGRMLFAISGIEGYILESSEAK